MTIREVLDRYWEGEINLEAAFTLLAEEGFCPALINDDYGLWAVELGSGYQQVPNIPGEPSTITTTFFIEKEYWQKTITDAFVYALRQAL